MSAPTPHLFLSRVLTVLIGVLIGATFMAGVFAAMAPDMTDPYWVVVMLGCAAAAFVVLWLQRRTEPPPVLYDQTIVSDEDGDCMRAALATVLQLDPSRFVNYSTLPESEHHAYRLIRDMAALGWDCWWTTPACGIEPTESPTGWYLAGVPSRMFPGEGHSVVVDADLKLVHDPNPQARRESVDPAEIQDLLVLGRRRWWRAVRARVLGWAAGWWR